MVFVEEVMLLMVDFEVSKATHDFQHTLAVLYVWFRCELSVLGTACVEP